METAMNALFITRPATPTKLTSAARQQRSTNSKFPLKLTDSAGSCLSPSSSAFSLQLLLQSSCASGKVQ